MTAVNWEEAGRGWGARAVEWAYLFEPYARPANELLFDRLGIGDGARLLDIACGSGFAAHLAAERKAQVSGLDAAEALVAIARTRTPSGDFRVGDMFELPFADDSFDFATSFNGIWKGCEGALREARRVLVPEVGWGSRSGVDTTVSASCRTSSKSSSCPHLNTGQPTWNMVTPGAKASSEDMLAATGFTLVERGAVDVVNEWPDAATAVRALAAAGPSVPAIEAVGYEAFCEALREVISPLCDRDVGVRVTSEFGWITAAAD